MRRLIFMKTNVWLDYSGETEDHGALVSLVNEAPMSKIVDAFIECPNQMVFAFVSISLTILLLKIMEL